MFVRPSEPRFSSNSQPSHTGCRGSPGSLDLTDVPTKPNQNKENVMNRVRVGMAAAAMAGAMLTGGVIGAVLFSATAVGAATPVATVTSPSPGGAPAADNGGVFKPNEDATHESTESAAREAQENAGQRPTVP
jgi:hypothetical protein